MTVTKYLFPIQHLIIHKQFFNSKIVLFAFLKWLREFLFISSFIPAVSANFAAFLNQNTSK